MYYNQRKMVLEILDTITQALGSIHDTPEAAPLLVTESLQGLISIDDFMSEQCAQYASDTLQTAANHIDALIGEKSPSTSQSLSAIASCKRYIKSLPLRYKIVFIPYIASMWSSLESIWKAADEDPNCDAYVVPIPYWNLKLFPDGSSKQTGFSYEGAQFPVYVPILDYHQFDLAAEQPDIIYIHNPYDDCNNLTRIPEEYYSENLKKHTAFLIYSPYYIQYTCSRNEAKSFLPIFKSMDFILLQSPKLADVYIRSGVSSKKILLLGSPKTDHIVAPICAPKIPPDWIEMAKGKRVILLNTHMSFILYSMTPSDSPNPVPYGMLFVKNIIQTVLSNPSCVLLWRPHPLVFQMLDSRGAKWHNQQMQSLMDAVSSAPNGILDFSSDYTAAFAVSDALVSLTGSSLLSEYILTKKPVTEFSYDRSVQWFVDLAKHSPFDIRSSYCVTDFINEEERSATDTIAFSLELDNIHAFLRLQRDVVVPRFLNMLCKGEDPLKEQRIHSVNKAFVNIDGTCGGKVHQEVKRRLAIKGF